MTLLLLSTLASGCESFVQQPQQAQLVAPSLTQLKTAGPSLPDLSDVLNGVSYVEPAAKEFIESSTEVPLTVNGGGEVSSFAPPLTYEKYLIMQVSVSF